jgi:hypothetical protein
VVDEETKAQRRVMLRRLAEETRKMIVDQAAVQVAILIEATRRTNPGPTMGVDESIEEINKLGD